MNRKQVFYIHGGEAFSDYEQYLHHLRTCELRSPRGEGSALWGSQLRNNIGDEFELFTPKMPNSENAKYLEWKIWFERHFDYLRDGVILVGWSQGAYFLLRYLTENRTPFAIKALVLVAPPFEPDDFEGEDGGDFKFDPAKLPALVKQVSNIFILHSRDDFVVPYEHAEKLKAALPEAELVTFTDRNHFLQPEFPELLDLLRKMA